MQRMKQWNNFMVILKDQWLTVIHNIRSIQEVLM